MLTTLACALALSTAAPAGISITSATRTTSVAAGILPAEVTESTFLFGDWSHHLYTETQTVPGSTLPLNYGLADQISTLSASGNNALFSAIGQVAGRDAYPAAGVGTGYGRTTIDVEFMITGIGLPPERSGYDAQFGFFATIGTYSFAAYRFELTGGSPGSDNLLYYYSPSSGYYPFGSGSVHQGGPLWLEPGTYHLHALFTDGYEGPGAGEGTTSYTFSLQIPGPGGAALISGFAGLTLARRRR